MSSSGTPSGASSPVPKIELGTAGAFRPGSAVGQTGQAPNGTLAGGAAGGVWATQGKGSMVSSPRSVPPVEAAKTRKKGLSVACPIAYGSLAFLLERKKQSEFVTHKWTCVLLSTTSVGTRFHSLTQVIYAEICRRFGSSADAFFSVFVRGPNGEDISYFVSKVVFTLHPSFAEATREVKSPPFEVTEMGWGEFEAKMTMHFKDPNEKPVDILHQLRLYHDAAAGTTQPKKAVVAEFYDEVVFTDPYEEFYNTLMQGQRLLPQRKHEHQEHFSTFSDGDTLQRLAAAREWVHNQLRETKDKIRKADMDMAQLKANATAGAGRPPGRPVPTQMRR